MSSEQLNKKFTFATPGKQPSSTRSGSKNTSPKDSTSSLVSPQQQPVPPLLITASNNSSSNFTIPLEALRLDESLISARAKVDNEANEEELIEAKKQLDAVEAIAENHAILEVTLDLKLLENNVEILVHSRSMNKSILEFLLADVIPVYVFGIIDSQLNEQVRNYEKKNMLKILIMR